MCYIGNCTAKNEAIGEKVSGIGLSVYNKHGCKEDTVRCRRVEEDRELDVCRRWDRLGQDGTLRRLLSLLEGRWRSLLSVKILPSREIQLRCRDESSLNHSALYHCQEIDVACDDGNLRDGGVWTEDDD